jgi:hypothetical protein
LKERFPLAVFVVSYQAMRRLFTPQNKSCQGNLTGVEPKHQLKNECRKTQNHICVALATGLTRNR